MKLSLQGYVVCVNYASLLELTLPSNIEHLNSLTIVTDYKDIATQQLAKKYNANLHVTDSFYADGAYFNKYRALQEAIDKYPPDGWTVLFDADIVWPEHMTLTLVKGCIYTPYRCVLENIELFDSNYSWYDSQPTNVGGDRVEFPGYTQIFHSDDDVLKEKPWFMLNCKHAGIADSVFQNRWTKNNKVRPVFKVLHLGKVGINWCGKENTEKLIELLAIRRINGNYSEELL